MTVRISTQSIALASARHPWRTIAAWAVTAALAIAAIGVLLGGALTTEGEPTNNPESERALEARAQAFPGRRSASDAIIVSSERFTVDSAQFRAFGARLASELRGIEGVVAVQSRGGPVSLVSSDRHAALVQLSVADADYADALIAAVVRADESPDFAVAVTGEKTRESDFNELSQDDLKSGELQFGLPAALIILLLVFGGVVAGLVPLLMAMFSIVVALGLTALVAQGFELSVFVVNMLTGMGLALGIDYALFIVSRYREERGGGRAKLDAISATGVTASRAVLFSGTAFVIAMFGMFIVPSSIMRSLAVGAILVGAVSVVAALTLLPALLGLLGDRVDSLRIPLIGSRSTEAANPEGRFWGAIVRRVLRRPGLSLALSVAFLLALASPIFGMTTGTSGVSALPERFESRQGFAALEREFPQVTTEPTAIVVTEGAGRPAARRALAGLRTTLSEDPRFGPGRIERSADGETAVLTVPVKGDPSGEAAIDGVRDLRSQIVPAAFRNTVTEVLVGGITAENIDYFDSVIDPAPIVIAFVLGLTFVLLTIVFRSVAIAGLSVVLNLLSVGAAFGLLVLVFQHGVGAGLFGFQQIDSIEAWVPLFLFSVLFGLSMDYQVFMLSRIKERYEKTSDTGDAVYFGVASTARIITGAALIIVAVFAGFARGDLIMFQQMGFGVAVALLIDATVIRSVLLPSAMTLLGRWNWYVPSWLEWLPRVRLEASSQS
ncbi:MAG: MMPL family transporter [Gaiellaceae bacterium]